MIPGPSDIVSSAIDHNPAGVKITDLHRDGSVSSFNVTWDEVTSIVAYKRDCFVVDLLCVGIETKDLWVETNEEMDSWKSMIDALPNYLPGMPKASEWWERVVQPPFAANWTPLWNRKYSEQ